MYKAQCPRWFGWIDNIRHIVVDKNTSENDVKKLAAAVSNNITGSKTCDIQLLQKYHMLIEAKKSYPSLTGLTFHETVIKNNTELGKTEVRKIQESEKTQELGKIAVVNVLDKEN